MRKALVATAVVAIALPASATAKTGIEFQQYPETAKVGQAIPFIVQIYKEPPATGGEAKPVAGVHPLVTFTSKSGRVLRVRSRRTDSAGVGHASVAFPDKGPWMATFHLKTHGVYVGTEGSQPIDVGTGLTQTTPATVVTHHDPPPAFPWVWVLSLA